MDIALGLVEDESEGRSKEGVWRADMEDEGGRWWGSRSWKDAVADDEGVDGICCK